MRWLIQVFLVMGFGILMISLLPTLFGQHAVPNFLYTIPIVLGIRQQFALALFWSIAGGFFLDLITPGLSWYTVLFCFAGLLTYLIVTEIFPNPTFLILLFLILTASFLLPVSEILTVNARWDWQILTQSLTQLVGFVLTLLATRKLAR